MTTKTPSVNFHLTKVCNMRCKFCFATFNDLENVKHDFHLSSEIIQQIAAAGFEKITFAGGEPTLVKELPALAKLAKSLGMTTTIVTNGTKLSEEKLYNELIPHVDWVAISIDSSNDFVNLASGRAIRGNTVLSSAYYLYLIRKLKTDKVKIKINTVVSRFNHSEDFNFFIEQAKPDRWKILQAMPVSGQNSNENGNFEITKEQFLEFLARNKNHNTKIDIVPEAIEVIRGSYVMISPEGCFFDSTKGSHTYSDPIQEVGVENALSQISYNYELFIKRGGLYDWSKKENNFPQRITISGEVASGKSTVGKLLAKKLQYSFVSLGNKIRSQAKKEGLSIVEFQKKCSSDRSLDFQIDSEFANECNQQNKIIIDYRMGYKFIESSYNIFLLVGEEEAEQRLKLASRYNESQVTIIERNKSFHEQFMYAYGEDYTNQGNYDLVVDTEQFNSTQAIVEYIIHKLLEQNTNGK